MGQLFGDKGMGGSIVDLERHRLQLQENISKLQKSLQYWQTWEAEYEGLKEEISDSRSHEQLKMAGDEFEGELLNQKEIKLLLEDARGQARSSQQILGLLERRIEYVQTNINSVKSLLQEAETKAAKSFAISQEVRNDEGLPLVEIREDLDDEGNVISSSITSPNDTAPLVVETLRKSGVEGLSDSKGQRLDVANITDDHVPSDRPTKVEGSGSSLAPAGVIKNVEPTVSKNDANGSVRRKKSVSFAKGTKEEDATTSKSRNTASKQQKARMTNLRKLLRPGISNQELVNRMNEELKRPPPNIQNLDQKETKETSEKKGESHSTAQFSNLAPSKPHVTEASTEFKGKDMNSGGDAFSAIIPASDTAEEAALRQQMIQYQTADVGPVVAEIDLDEGNSETWTGEDDPDAWTDSDEVNDSSTEEDEDDYGRTKRRVISDEYRQEMLALEEKLNLRLSKNIGPEGNRRAVTNEKPENANRSIENEAEPLARKASPSKEVRFATDIQKTQDDKSAPTSEPTPQPKIPPQDPPTSKKSTVSRFKAERTTPSSSSSPSPSPSTIPTPPPFATSIHERPYTASSSSPSPSSSSIPSPNPPSAITSNTIIERPYKAASPSSPAPPSSSSDDDPALVHQQLTMEYHKLRNRMIYRQEGFLAADEDENDEDEVEGVGREVRGGVGELGGEVMGNENANTNENLEQGGSKKISRFLAARLKGYPPPQQ